MEAPEASVPRVLDALLKSNAPVPANARPCAFPDTTPESVSCVPATRSALSAPKVTVPDRLLLPVDAASVPPFRVMACVPSATPCKSNVEPLSTVVAPLPSPLAWAIPSVPALTVVAPV